MQLMSRCSHAGKLSWVTSGQSEEVVCWATEDPATKTGVQKYGRLRLTFIDLRHSFDL